MSLDAPTPEVQALLNRYARAERTLHEEQRRVRDARDVHKAARERLAAAQTEYTAARFAAGHHLPRSAR